MSDNTKQYYRELSALSSLKAFDAKEFVEAQGIKAVLDYIESGEIDLPFIGKLTIEHTGDVAIRGGVRAEISVSFTPNPFLLNSIGQNADGVETEAEKLYTEKIRKSLKLLQKGD